MKKITEKELVNMVLEEGFRKSLETTEMQEDEMLQRLYLMSKRIEATEKKPLLKILKQQLEWKRNVIVARKIGVLADIQIGTEKENWDYIEKASHTFLEQEINELLVIGNMFKGCRQEIINGNEKKAKETCQRQLEDFAYFFPKDFIAHVILGESGTSFKKVGINLKEEVEAMKSNIEVLDFTKTYLTWNERKLLAKERLKNRTENEGNSLPVALEPCDLSLYASAMYYKYLEDYKGLKLPACSNVQSMNNKNQYRPGFVILEDQDTGIVISRYGFTNDGVERMVKKKVKN